MEKIIQGMPPNPAHRFFVFLSFFIAFSSTACKKDAADPTNVTAKNAVASLNCDFVVSTLAGTGLPGYVDGPANTAQFFLYLWHLSQARDCIYYGVCRTTDTFNHAILVSQNA